MAASDWINAGLGAYSWYNQRKSEKDATHATKEGYDQGRADVQKYADPYFEQGLKNMDQYNQMGEFDFQFDQDDPSYQWRLEEGLRGTQRSQAANKMLGSGNTLAALQTRGQNEASQEYQAEFDRDLQSYDTNKQYNQFGMELGANAGQFAGQYMSDMAIGIGAADAAYQTNTGRIDSGAMDAIGNALGEGGGAALKQGVNYAMEKMGMGESQALEWAKTKVAGMFGAGGGGVGTAASMFGGGAASGMGTGLGAVGTSGMVGESAMGITGMAEGFGGTYGAATGAGTATGATTATAAGFGTWAASVAGGAALMVAIKMGVEALRADPEVSKTLEGMMGSEDPLGWVDSNVSSVVGLHARDNSVISGGYQRATAGGSPHRGMMYSTVLANISPEGATAMQSRDDIGRIVGDMWSATVGGYAPRTKYTGGAIPAPSEGLMKMFPSLADDINRLYTNTRADISAEGRIAGGDGRQDDEYAAASRRIRSSIDLPGQRAVLEARMNTIMAGWEVESFIDYSRSENAPSTGASRWLGG